MASDSGSNENVPWSPGQPHAWSAGELKRLVEAEREHPAFICFRDSGEEQQIVPLTSETSQATIGRREGVDILLDWDSEVSRLHCILESMGGQWTVSDDGLSRNGTFVNSERVVGSRRLSDGDILICGNTSLLFRSGHRSSVATVIGNAQVRALRVTPAQRRVLASLAEPSVKAGRLATPASNAEIAAELVVSVETVKSHMKALVRLFDLEDVPSSQKRMRLVEEALRLGLVGNDDP